MAANRVATFLEHLRASRLLTPEQLAEVERKAPAAGDDPTPLGKEIRRRGWLTSYQIKQVARGRNGLLSIGPYRLIDQLGEGGMGHVFKAVEEETCRTVALKVIRKDRLDNASALKRFQREIETTQRLSHPNIVGALAAGEISGTPYLAMEYVEGMDLGKLVQDKGPLPVGDACEYVRQAALGLQHAHEKGLVHRDIKPSNLLVDAEGSCKLLDLGLARALDTPADSKLTRIGSTVGTPEFLAPEQAKDSSAVDIRADLYSLGCTLHFLLTGQPPFRGETPNEVMLKHFDGIPAPLAECRADVPSGLQAVLSRLLAKKPEDRYATPAELAAALLPFTADGAKPNPEAEDEEVVNEPTADAEARDESDEESDDATPNYGRRRMLVAAAAVLLVVGGVGAVHLALSGHRTPADVTSPQVVQARDTQPVPDVVPDPRAVQAPKADPNAAPKFEEIPEAPKVIPEKEDPKPAPKEDPKPAPKEDPKPAPKEDPKPRPKADPPAQPAKKFRLPTGDTIAKARTALHEKYREEYARKRREDMEALAERFLNQAPDAAGEPIEQLALFYEARDLWLQLGKLDKALLIYDQIEHYFECDPLRLKTDFLARLKINDAAGGDAALHAALLVLAPVLDRDQFNDVRLLLTVASLAAQRIGAAPAIRLVQSLTKELEKMEKEYSLVKWSVQTLTSRPDDPKANYAWGRYLALVKGNFDKGLPLLAKGSNAELKRIAQLDLDSPRDPARQKGLGDSWTEAAKKEQGSPQKRALLRARYWYEQAVARLEGSARQAVLERMKEIETAVLYDEDALRAQITNSLAQAATQMAQQVAIAQIAEQQAQMAAQMQAVINEQVRAYSKMMEEAQKRQQAYSAHMARAQHLMGQKQYAAAAGEFGAALAAMPGDRAATNGLQQAQQAMRGR